ncbi:unnamed protein product [Acanthoscelides obtectus]|uniref:Uncharacterized protein n=1 Tax=Acanthoscelides obtectus TaxID=200917 RepID=A0A9P0LG66_ACAOB|nr:unnamed protein product [Acanthoscelides obtectus]CAK1635424.1 hypothetical protein AOBTE_LOCUS9265 [Acanthoscelides obtectus]
MVFAPLEFNKKQPLALKTTAPVDVNEPSCSRDFVEPIDIDQPS